MALPPSAAQSLQFCPPLWDPMDCRLPVSSIRGIFQAKTLESITTLSYMGSPRPRDQIHVSCTSFIAGRFFIAEPLGKPLPVKWSEVKSQGRVRLFATPWTVAHQAPPPMGFSRQEYWSRLPFPSPGDLPNPRIEPRAPTLQADALTSEPPGKWV